MFKVTKDGVEDSGQSKELSKEDLEFIGEMFEEFSNYQRQPLNEPKRDHND